jgi:hypothetical protein
VVFSPDWKENKVSKEFPNTLCNPIVHCLVHKSQSQEHIVSQYAKQERMGIIWWKAGFWKLGGIRKGFEMGKFPIYLGEEVAMHVLLKCSEFKKWREE